MFNLKYKDVAFEPVLPNLFGMCDHLIKLACLSIKIGDRGKTADMGLSKVIKIHQKQTPLKLSY